MKRTKKEIGFALLEGLLELVLALFCFGIGALILSLCGVDFTIDYDLVILLGVAVFLVVFIGAYFLVQWIKKKLGGGRK